MKKFTTEELIKILEKVLYFEGLRCDEFAERDREAIFFRLSERERDQWDYSVDRYNRIRRVINWLKKGIFPDDSSYETPVSIESYCNEYFSTQTYKLEYVYDILNYFENKMFEEWKKKLKETQVIKLA